MNGHVCVFSQRPVMRYVKQLGGGGVIFSKSMLKWVKQNVRRDESKDAVCHNAFHCQTGDGRLPDIIYMRGRINGLEIILKETSLFLVIGDEGAFRLERRDVRTQVKSLVCVSKEGLGIANVQLLLLTSRRRKRAEARESSLENLGGSRAEGV